MHFQRQCTAHLCFQCLDRVSLPAPPFTNQNTVVCELRDAHLPELKTVTTRSRAMVTCYPGQRRGYTKHCDNAVRNGRKLTAILYLNQNWTEADGGELKIYPNYTTDQIKCSHESLLKRVFGFDPRTCAVLGSAVAVRPIANRLVLFWSDMRCPHEVRNVIRAVRSMLVICLRWVLLIHLLLRLCCRCCPL